MDYILHVLVLAGMYAIYAMSLNLELGYAGLYNFGHVAFFGVGAYVSALLTLGGWPVEPSLVAAALLAGLAGAVFAWGSLRLTGDYFGMATLAFAEMFRLLALNERWLTRGPLGLPGIPRPGWMGQGMSGLPHFLVFELVVAAGVWWLLRRLTASPFGRALKVIREDEQVAQALGKNLLSFRVRAVAAGSALAGLVGGLWAHYITYISPNDFTLQGMILVLLCVVLGGKATMAGPVVGAVAVIFFQEALRFLPFGEQMGRYVAPLQGMVFGLALVLLMLKRPEGLIPEFRGDRAPAGGAAPEPPQAGRS